MATQPVTSFESEGPSFGIALIAVFVGQGLVWIGVGILIVGLSPYLGGSTGWQLAMGIISGYGVQLVLRFFGYDISLFAACGAQFAAALLGVAIIHAWPPGGSTFPLPFFAGSFAAIPGQFLSAFLVKSLATRSSEPSGFHADRLAKPQSTAIRVRAAPQQTRVFDDPHAGDPTAGAYSETILAVRESALGLVGTVNNVHPDSVPTVIADGLISYEAATKRLEQAQLPSAVPAELNQRLVAGLKQLEDDLILTAEDAATTAGSRLYQRGFLTPSMGDASDGGARYRWDLEQSDGLRAVKQALSELRALGFGSM